MPLKGSFMKYKVVFREVVRYTVTVDARNPEEAEKLVRAEGSGLDNSMEEDRDVEFVEDVRVVLNKKAP